MNKERILEVADAIENHKIADLGFNMNYEYFDPKYDGADRSGHNCNTVACILGWVNAMDGRRGSTSKDEAETTLGINSRLGDNLFYPDDVNGYDDVTPREAAITLRKLARTGEVDWSHAIGYTP